MRAEQIAEAFPAVALESNALDAVRLLATHRLPGLVVTDTAGMPVTFHAEVHGVNAFWASKSAAGSSSSRRAPIGSGGAESVGVSTASYGASAVRQSAA